MSDPASNTLKGTCMSGLLLLDVAQFRRRYQLDGFLYRLLPGIFLALVVGPSVCVGQQSPPGPGKEPFERVCSPCHALNAATRTKRAHTG